MNSDMIVTGVLLILGAGVYLYSILRDEPASYPQCYGCRADCKGQYLVVNGERFCQRCADGMNLPPW